MSRDGVLLYGPPASGKDTVSRELKLLDPRWSVFPRIKVGGGRQKSYRVLTEAELSRLVAAGEIVWVNNRYGATYAIDRSGLVAHLRDHTTIIHIGQPEAIEAIQSATPEARWLTVQLWCPRDIAEQRLIERGTENLSERLAAWDETQPLNEADCRIDTAERDATAAAGEIAGSLADRV